jgi:hypothetical protein
VKQYTVSEQTLDMIQRSLEDTTVMAVKHMNAKRATLANPEGSIVLTEMASNVQDAKIAISAIKTMKKGTA